MSRFFINAIKKNGGKAHCQEASKTLVKYIYIDIYMICIKRLIITDDKKQNAKMRKTSLTEP